MVHSMEPTQTSPDESTNPAQPQQDRRGDWLFPALLLLVLVAAAVLAISNREQKQAPTDSAPAAWTPAEQPAGETVQLVVDFGNGASRRFDALPWQEEMTVGDLLAAATQFRPALQYAQQGEGASGFLVSLEGVSNEGSKGRNWRYLVNERLGQTSFCVAKLESGDRVLWEFTSEY